jgi:hypothetical protein
MPETAGTAIRIGLTSAEFVHFTHMMCLSYAEGAPPPQLTNRAGEEAGKDWEGEDDRWARACVINARILKIETKVLPGSKIYGKNSKGR